MSTLTDNELKLIIDLWRWCVQVQIFAFERSLLWDRNSKQQSTPKVIYIQSDICLC